jgi:hypothetical protein
MLKNPVHDMLYPTHYCPVCDASFQSASALTKYKNGRDHIKEAAKSSSPEACSQQASTTTLREFWTFPFVFHLLTASLIMS